MTRRTPTDKAPDRTVQTAFRLPVALVADLDAHAAQLNAEQPGMRFTRADVVRVLLTEGLARAAGEGR